MARAVLPPLFDRQEAKTNRELRPAVHEWTERPWPNRRLRKDYPRSVRSTCLARDWNEMSAEPFQKQLAFRPRNRASVGWTRSWRAQMGIQGCYLCHLNTANSLGLYSVISAREGSLGARWFRHPAGANDQCRAPPSHTPPSRPLPACTQRV